MKNIVLYEAKKLVKAKSFVLLCVLFAVLNIIISFFGVPTEGGVVQEKYDKVAANVIYTAKVNLSQIVDKESESALYQKDIIARFEKLQGSVKVAPVKGYDSLLISPYPYLSALVFCGWVALHSALSEYSANLTLLSCKKKRGAVALAKLFVLCACALGAVLLFCLSYALGTLFAASFGGALAPVQSIAAYIRCPYEINVLTAVALRVLFAFAAALLAAVAVHLAALAVKKIIPALVCIIALVGLDYIVTDAAKTDIFALFYNFNFRVLTDGTFLSRYSGMKIGMFVTQPFIMLAVLLLGVAVFGVLSVIVFRKTVSIKSAGTKRAWGRNRRARGKSLAFYELKKLFRGKTVIVVMILVLFKLFALDMQVEKPNSDYENVYKYYLAEMEDMGYTTQGAYVARETNRCLKAIAEAEEYMNAYIDNKADDHDKFLECAASVGAYELKYEVLKDIKSQLDDVNTVREKGLDAKLIYATGWNALFSLATDYICVILLAFVLVPYVMLDKESKLEPVVRASAIGKKHGARILLARKMLLMLGFAVLTAVSFFALDLWLVHNRIGLASLGEYAVGTVLPELLWGLRLWQVLLLRAAMALVGAALTVATAHILGKFTQNSMAALLIFALSQFFAALISNMTNMFFIT
ncbi:MAG: hypothetical protein IJW21_05720 [Clostridia bacterium]|nr:hypothetical protein [Clostridia bacterium]